MPTHSTEIFCKPPFPPSQCLDSGDVLHDFFRVTEINNIDLGGKGGHWLFRSTFFRFVTRVLARIVGCLSASFSTCFPLSRFKSLPPCVNNLFRGISFSDEDTIHEHIQEIQESLLLGRRTKGNLAWCFHSFLLVSKRGFLQKISHFNWKESQVNY